MEQIVICFKCPAGIARTKFPMALCLWLSLSLPLSLYLPDEVKNYLLWLQASLLPAPLSPLAVQKKLVICLLASVFGEI